MGRKQGPRKGSMQVWPRKRADKVLPSVNWKEILIRNANEKTNFLGFIGYKAGMASAFVKDNTANSMMKGKKVIVPVTVIECPTVKIFSVRFYKNGKVAKEVLNDNLDKELKRVIRFPDSKTKRNAKEAIEKVAKEGFEDIRVVIYSQVRKSFIKKAPDLIEVALSGKKEEKLEFVKNELTKEISIVDVFNKGILDVRAVSKGRGFSGSVKRFGVRYRNHKAEKGQKKVGSIGGWHPKGVRFTVPRPGQLGFFSRLVYNNAIISSKKFTSDDLIVKRLFDNYGMLNTDYIIIRGSIPGSPKRAVFLTATLRPSKNQIKRQYELIELR